MGFVSCGTSTRVRARQRRSGGRREEEGAREGRGGVVGVVGAGQVEDSAAVAVRQRDHQGQERVVHVMEPRQPRHPRGRLRRVRHPGARRHGYGGCVCCWSPKNPLAPERVIQIESDAGVSAVHFSKQHLSLLAVGNTGAVRRAQARQRACAEDDSSTRGRSGRGKTAARRSSQAPPTGT